MSELVTLATLAGFTTPIAFAWRLRPDVARVCPWNGALFLGDAKDTESPGCAATWDRLFWYFRASSAICSERPLTVALAVPARVGQHWNGALREAVRHAGLIVLIEEATELGDTLVLAARLSKPRP